ncbi:Retrotransposon gag protein [Gossypium australe]|uniref:Retrotransposon gag protein n=1 Tax=Gossypium australe TaxID=47621 RepID=A0A5B6WNY3_9ROSI|nr:Retrotransposon gag protein [Gossypium australe]
MHKKVIGWTIVDIKGINPVFCQHKIRLKYGKKPVVDAQRRLNLAMKEVVQKELLKWLDKGIVVCINYKKLNDAMKINHFPLPFIDQMLDHLVGKDYYCFLDGYSRYHQIPIHPDDHEKTTFTCSFGTYAFKRIPFGLCNAPVTFMRCMTTIFADMLEEGLDVFMDDFSVYGDSVQVCLGDLKKVLKR